MILMRGELIELLNVAFFDFLCIFVILTFIDNMYFWCYGRVANRYMKNQFNLLLVNSLACTFVMRTYFFIKMYFQIEDKNDFLLSAFLMFGGMLTHSIYPKVRKTSAGSYKPSDGEYTFVCIVSVIAIGIKLWADRIIPIYLPMLLVLSRLSGWLDTKNPLEILREIKPNHARITESSLLLLAGMCIIALVIRYVNLSLDVKIKEIAVSFIYGLVILFPYRYSRDIIIRNILKRRVQNRNHNDSRI